jgi:hypothetical protein
MPKPLKTGELRATLYAYLNIRPGSYSDAHPWVRWLSHVLRQLPYYPPEVRLEDESFRPAGGVRRRIDEFRKIDEGRQPRKLSSYRKVWRQYEEDLEALREDVRQLLEEHAIPATSDPDVQAESLRRRRMWHRLQEAGGPTGIRPQLARDLGIYGSQAGIWTDKAQTDGLGPAGGRVAVCVYPIGDRYPDDLSSGAMIYKYPDTGRPGTTDAAEIQATKNAGRLGLPIFVELRHEGDQSLRDIRWGAVADWNDEASEFLIRFREELKDLTPKTRRSADGPGRRPFQLAEERPESKSPSPDRPGQKQFRFDVKRRYGLRCAVCDQSVEALLEAIHVRDRSESGSNDPRNGLLLCRNHHKAFDEGLFGIHPGSGAICVRKEGPSAEELGVERGHLSTKTQKEPHPEALRWAWDQWTDDLGEGAVETT